MNEANLLTLLGSASMAIVALIKSYNTSKITNEMLQKQLTDSYVSAAVATIQNEFTAKDRAVNEYARFYKANIDNISKEISTSANTQESKFATLQKLVSVTYICESYLLSAGQIESAKILAKQSSNELLPNHYIPRAVLTLSARNGEALSRGWFIGTANSIYDEYDQVRQVFYNDKESFQDYICQVDFLQFLLEYQRKNDIFAGYPTFLFYPPRRALPLVKKLINGKDAKAVKDVIKFASEFNGGEFFTNNQWRGVKNHAEWIELIGAKK